MHYRLVIEGCQVTIVANVTTTCKGGTIER